MLLVGRAAASVLLDRLVRVRTSPTVLFWLRLRPSTLKPLELGGALLRLCEELGVDAPNLGESFFEAVREAAEATACVAPDVFFASPKKDECIRGYQETLALARRKCADRDRYHLLGGAMPFCYQLMREYFSTRLKKKLMASLFLMFAAPEDGMNAISDLLRGDNRWVDPHSGYPSVYPQVIEQRWGARERDVEAVDNRLSYLITDWEAYRLHAEGRLSDRQMTERMEAFPLWFYQQLVLLRLVSPSAVVVAVLKNKSRAVTTRAGEPDFKFSAHTTFGIAGVPSVALAHACAAVFAPYKDRIHACKDSYAGLADEDLELPWFGADIKALGGNTGFSTYGSRKKAGDDMPVLKYRYEFCQGLERCRVPVPQPDAIAFTGPRAMPHESIVECLRGSLCTVPGFYMVPLTPNAEKDAETKHNRNASKRRQAVSGAGPPLGGTGSGSGSSAGLRKNLPAWVSLEIPESCHLTVNAAATYKHHIEKLVQGTDEWSALHVPSYGFYCPVSLCKPKPIKKRHSRNGVIIVYHPEVHDFVYVRCTQCEHGQEVHNEATVVGRGFRRTWAQFTETGFTTLLRLSKEG